MWSLGESDALRTMKAPCPLYTPCSMHLFHLDVHLYLSSDPFPNKLVNAKKTVFLTCVCHSSKLLETKKGVMETLDL